MVAMPASDRPKWRTLQREVEDVEVLRHSLAVHGLRDDDDAALDEPAQYDLGGRLAVRLTDLGEGRVGEQVASAFGERSPRLDLHAAL